jgi:hypothetical protein
MVSKAEKRARVQAKLEAKTATSTPVADSASPPSNTTPAAEKQGDKPKVVTKVVGVLKVKDGLNFRGARQAWYEELKAHDGKPAQEYLDATTKKAPSLPKSGKQEPSSGWLRWFVRHEVASIIQTKAEKEVKTEA